VEKGPALDPADLAEVADLASFARLASMSSFTRGSCTRESCGPIATL
jgi:hypothetical protein